MPQSRGRQARSDSLAPHGLGAGDDSRLFWRRMAWGPQMRADCNGAGDDSRGPEIRRGSGRRPPTPLTAPPTPLPQSAKGGKEGREETREAGRIVLLCNFLGIVVILWAKCY